MNKSIIKICGIKHPDMAKLAIMAGANLIGIVFHPASSRYVTPADAISIVDAVSRAGAIPVGIFVNQTVREMREICEQINIDTVQLHGVISRAHHQLLPKHFKRIYVQNLSNQGDLVADEGLQYLKPERDLILIDHNDPGKGKSINRKRFHYHLPFSWLLAGGLSPVNVTTVMADLQPDGVDVSSGVELSSGIKDPLLIQQFISAVRGHHD